MLKMNEMQSYSYDEAHAGYGDAGQVNTGALLTRQDVAQFKFFEARENQMFGDAGVGAGRLSWSDYSLGSNIHSANFTWVDASSMVPTGSWGSPSENFFTAISNDGHAISSFDLIDVIPTNGVFLDGVRNGYALIEDRNFWSINNQINDATEECGPSERDDIASERSSNPRLNIQSEYQNQHNASAKSAGFSSEYFGIAHIDCPAQISHEYMVSHESGEFRG